jgi:toxin secretion/phage lysis holin
MILLYIVIADILLGLLHSGKNRRWSSRIGKAGLMTHAIELIIPITFYPLALEGGIIAYYDIIVTTVVFTEAISIVENLKALGVPVPDVLINMLKDKTRDKEG